MAKTTTIKKVSKVKKVNKPIAGKDAVVPSEAKKTATPKSSKEKSVKIRAVNMKGSDIEPMDVPVTLFGAKINTSLIAQAVRVYRANQREGSAATKGRGQVEGSTRKIYRQKGTGRARHGSIRAPIFVGGGLVFGPEPRSYRLKFPDAMKKKALVGALTDKANVAGVIVVHGSDTMEPKTKHMALLMRKIAEKKRVLFVYDTKDMGAVRAIRNIGDVTCIRGSDIHTYAVCAHDVVLCTQRGMDLLIQTFT